MLGLAPGDAWDQLEHARRSPAQRIGFPGPYLVIVIGMVTATSTSAIHLPAPSTRSLLNGDMGWPHSRRTQSRVERMPRSRI